ncbi:MAG: hypothetical protein WC975_07465 [Phycisphaerae bacterium]
MTNAFRGDRLTRLLFFLGFSGLVGWLGSTWFLFHLSKWMDPGIPFDMTRTLDLPPAVMLFGKCLLRTSFFLFFVVLGFFWGLPRLKIGHEKKILAPLVVAILLSPVYVVSGTLLALSTPAWNDPAKASNKIVQSIDRKSEAFLTSLDR